MNEPNSFAAGADAIVDFGRDIWTVSRLNSEVRATLDASFPLLWVQGEISNLARPPSGHLYFSLKDEAAQVSCAMFRFKRRLLRFEPANGAQVLVRARVGLYEPRGAYQLLVESMEPAGEGALRLELEQRKRRLAAEGLFDESLKRQLPAFPRQVGLITSPSGAAVHDLLTVLGRRLPLLPVLIYPAQVQGADGAASLLQALSAANRRADCDLLILARGGGSLEDLMPFNDEALARAIRASAIPVVTGVGHEIDTSIADLAADRRGATPSAAAELATPSAQHLAERVAALRGRLVIAERRLLDTPARRLQGTLRQLRLLHPMGRLQRQAQSLDLLDARLRAVMARALEQRRARAQSASARQKTLSPSWRIRLLQSQVAERRRRLPQAMGERLDAARAALALAAAGLQGRSPLATLARGYAVATRIEDGAVLRDADTIAPGERLALRLHRGALRALVEAPLPTDDG